MQSQSVMITLSGNGLYIWYDTLQNDDVKQRRFVCAVIGTNPASKRLSQLKRMILGEKICSDALLFLSDSASRKLLLDTQLYSLWMSILDQ